MDGLRTRHAVAADVETLVPILGELFALEPDFRFEPARQRRGLLMMLDDRLRRAVLVAERSGQVIGMATGQLVVSTAEGASSVVVEDVVVTARERGRGVGRLLLQAVEAWARSRGATRLTLVADRGNSPALAFYERLGWAGTRLVCLHRRCR